MREPYKQYTYVAIELASGQTNYNDDIYRLSSTYSSINTTPLPHSVTVLTCSHGRWKVIYEHE